MLSSHFETKVAEVMDNIIDMVITNLSAKLSCLVEDAVSKATLEPERKFQHKFKSLEKDTIEFKQKVAIIEEQMAHSPPTNVPVGHSKLIDISHHAGSVKEAGRKSIFTAEELQAQERLQWSNHVMWSFLDSRRGRMRWFLQWLKISWVLN